MVLCVTASSQLIKARVREVLLAVQSKYIY